MLFFGQHAVEPLDFLDDLPLRALADAFGIADVMHGVALGLELDALEFARQKPLDHCRAETGCAPGLALRVEHDEAGQVVGLRAQAVEQPRTHARPALDDRAAVHERVGRIVIDLLGLIERTMQMSSAISAMCGKRSEISWPDLPYFLNSTNGPRALSTVFCSCASCWPLVNDSGNGWPSSPSTPACSRTFPDAKGRRPCRGG